MNNSNDSGGLSMTGADNSESSVNGVSDRVSKIENQIDMFVTNLLPHLIDCRSSNGYGEYPPYEVISYINFKGVLQINTISVTDNYPLHITLGNDKYIRFSNFTNDVTFNCKANFEYTDKYGSFQNYEITGIIDKVFDIEKEQKQQIARNDRIESNFNILSSKVTSFQTDINTNTSNIEKNRDDINKNTDDILKNTNDILENKAATSLNTNDIATIKNNVEVNTYYINLHKNSIDSIQKNSYGTTNKIDELERKINNIQNFNDQIFTNINSLMADTEKMTFSFSIQTTLLADGKLMFYNGLHTKYISDLDSYIINSITMMITDSNTTKYKNLPDITLSSENILKAELIITEYALVGDGIIQYTSTNISVDINNSGSRIIQLQTPFIVGSNLSFKTYITASLIHKTNNKIVADFILNAKPR